MSAMDVDDAPAASAMTIEARIAELEESEIALLDGEPRPLGDACAHLLLAYLAGDRLEDARHLWRRTGEAARAAAPALGGAWAAGRCLWRRSDVPGALRALEAGPWPADAASLAAEAAAAVRDRELALFAEAYGEIRLAKVAAALACSDQRALEACRARGWVFCATAATLKPKAPAPPGARFDGFEQLAHLTAIVTQLSA